MKGGEIFIGERESDTGRDEKRKGGRQKSVKAGGGRGGSVGGERCERTRGERRRMESWRYEERTSVGGVGKGMSTKCEKRREESERGLH